MPMLTTQSKKKMVTEKGDAEKGRCRKRAMQKKGDAEKGRCRKKPMVTKWEVMTEKADENKKGCAWRSLFLCGTGGYFRASLTASLGTISSLKT